MHAPSSVKRKVSYRSMKNFCENSFAIDMSHVPFHVCNVFDDVDDIYWAEDLLFTSVLNEHALLKTRYISKPQVPYMNSELRKAMNQRNMWRSKYFKKNGDHHLRQMYVKWRNKVTELRTISIQKYFDEICSSSSNSRDFYKTVKPFIWDKNSCSGNRIILSEDKNIISDPLQVANIFNRYHSSISDYKDNNDGLDILNLGEVIAKHASHKSIE